MSSPGSIGRYRLLKKLASGGMAEVYLAALDGPDGFTRQLVVKRVLPQYADDSYFRELFLCEAKLAARLNHPNVVQLFDFGEADGEYFIAMEFVEGLQLRVLARRLADAGAPVPAPVAVR